MLNKDGLNNGTTIRYVGFIPPVNENWNGPITIETYDHKGLPLEVKLPYVLIKVGLESFRPNLSLHLALLLLVKVYYRAF